MEPEVTPHDSTVSSWIKIGHANETALLKVIAVIRVDEDREDALEKMFYAVSTPGKLTCVGNHSSIRTFVPSRLYNASSFHKYQGMNSTASTSQLPKSPNF